jgi:DNA topoisomerase VI subunit B
MNTYDETVRHVVENFPLFGFGDAETAMFQCIKELLDNSLDSLRDDTRPTGMQSDVKIHLRGVEYFIMAIFLGIIWIK